jgi:hypothetical protein
MALERWTDPKLSRRTRIPRYGLQSKSACVAKRPRELPPEREIPHVTIRFATFASLYGAASATNTLDDGMV